MRNYKDYLVKRPEWEVDREVNIKVEHKSRSNRKLIQWAKIDFHFEGNRKLLEIFELAFDILFIPTQNSYP